MNTTLKRPITWNRNSRNRCTARGSARAAGSLLALIVCGCNLTDPSPFDPRGLQRDSRAAAADVAAPSKRPLPTTLQSPFVNGKASTKPSIDDNTGLPLGTEPTVRLSLQEVIQRAISNNGEIRVAGYTPAIDETRVIEAESRFDLTFFSNAGVDRTATGTAFDVAGQGFTTYSLDAGLRQNLPSGGQIELRQRNSITNPGDPGQFGSSTSTRGSVYVNDLQLQLQQPLLRDFGNEINRARISINRNNQKISILEFRRQIEETISQLERDYWQLVQAERELRIQERLLQRTIDTAFILLQRGGEDVTQVQISQANASVEARRSELIRARARVRDLSDSIKRAMQDPTMPVSSPLVVLPATPPVEQPVKIELADVVASAFENRFELGQQTLRVDNAGIASKVAKNNLLPQLNLQETGSIQGVDPQYIDALAGQPTFEDYGFNVALQFEIPIGNRGARAIYQRAMLQRMQAIEQYRSLIAQVELEVKQAWREVDTTWNEIAANRQARFAAADALAAIERRARGGEPLVPTFVQLTLDRQEALAQAERAEAQAISAYNIAIARLELAKGTLLRYNNILIEEEDMPFVKTMGYNGR